MPDFVKISKRSGIVSSHSRCGQSYLNQSAAARIDDATDLALATTPEEFRAVFAEKEQIAMCKEQLGKIRTAYGR